MRLHSCSESVRLKIGVTPSEIQKGMGRVFLPRAGLSTLLAAGVLAWGSLSLRGATEWVFHVTRGLCFKDLQDIAPHDVGIVPGSRFRRGQPNPQLEERLLLSLALYKSGRVGTLLVSGDEERAGHEVSGMRQWLTDRGVPAARVIADPLGVRTLETMKRASHVFGIRSAVICTQSWAAPRALFLAQGSGIDAIALVPQTVHWRNADLFSPENLKIALAFVERYLLGRTGESGANRDLVAARIGEEPIESRGK